MFHFRVKVSEVLHGATNPVVPTKNYVEVISFHLINKKFPSFHVICYLPTTKTMSSYLIHNILQAYRGKKKLPLTFVTKWASKDL